MKIGIDLAGLLTAARAKSATGDGVPRYVVRSAPIHRIGSLLAEEADVSAYADILCSCQAAITKLASKGLLVASEEKHGRSYLKLHERVWPSEPLIADGAELYLDDLSVTYLHAAGVLDKLKSAGLTAYITESDDSDANRLIAVDNLSDRQLEVIESIRRNLAGGLQSGKVKAVRSQEPDQQGPIRMHPTFGVFDIGEAVDAFVVDDRFINCHDHMTRDSQPIPILCSLDILDELQRRGEISMEHLFARRTHLRRAGFQLIPVREDELLHHLARAAISQNALVETAELRAVRESLLRVRMSKMLQIPLEAPWLQQSTNAITKAVKRLWQIYSETKDAAVRGQWLVDLLDLRGFAASAVPGNERTFAQYAQASQILLPLTTSLNVPASVRDTYLAWIDEAILKDIKTGQPEVFSWLVERARELIAHSSQLSDPGAGGMMSEEAYVRASRAVLAMKLFPKLIRDALITDDGFRAEYGLATDAVVAFGNSGVSFQRSLLLEAVKQAFDPAMSRPTVEDTAGQSWQVDVLSGDTPTIAVAGGTQQFVLAGLAMLSPDRDTRLRVFRHEADRLNLPLAARRRWEELLTARVPDDDALSSIQKDLNDTPSSAQETIQYGLSTASIALDVLVPRSLSYYERLIGPFTESQSFEGLADAVARHMNGLVDWRAFEGYQHALLLAAQPALGAGLNTLAISPEELVKIYDWLIAHGDVMSRAAAIESGLGLIQGAPELRAPLRRLIEAAISSDQITAQVDAFQLLSALTILNYGELAYTRVLASRPPYWRRLAAMAQAALIARCVSRAGVDAGGFVEWASHNRSQMFLLQCFVDLRQEPRWTAELILCDQLRSEFGGRILTAANVHAAAVNNAGWQGLLLDDSEGSLRRQLDLSRAFLPGPLEGGTAAVMEIPDPLLTEIRENLGAPRITAASFSKLVNASALFHVPPDLAGLAADAIARADYRLELVDSTTPILPFLMGLATVAGITRCHKLTAALLVVSRKSRRYHPDELEIDGAFRVALIASASHAELADWCKCVGQCMTDLAFQDLTRDDAQSLHARIVSLCHLVPELWATCGQAEAALRAVPNI